MSLKKMGSRWISLELTIKVLLAYNHYANVSEAERDWPTPFGLDKIIQEVNVARNQLSLDENWQSMALLRAA
jgi:hypothetical protein